MIRSGRATTGDALHPYSAGGAYVNILMGRGRGARHARPTARTTTALVEVKRRYDPTNLFRINQNIAP